MSTQLMRVDDFDVATSAGEDNITLPRIGNSMEMPSKSERDSTKKRSHTMNGKSLDQPRMTTIPIIESLGNDETP